MGKSSQSQAHGISVHAEALPKETHSSVSRLDARDYCQELDCASEDASSSGSRAGSSKAACEPAHKRKVDRPAIRLTITTSDMSSTASDVASTEAPPTLEVCSSSGAAPTSSEISLQRSVLSEWASLADTLAPSGGVAVDEDAAEDEDEEDDVDDERPLTSPSGKKSR